jgi:ABC-type transport system involved in multi-copper enzyme maturation permease subunit
MNALLRAEAVKLRTLRTPWALLGLVVVISGGLISLVGILSGTRGNPSLHRGDLPDLLSVPAMLTCGIVLVLAILSSAGEFRTGTISGSLLITPRRERFLAGKLVAAALLGLIFAATTLVTTYTATVVVVLARDLPVDLASAAGIQAALGIAAAAGLIGTAGAALGMTVRNQTVAVVAALVWWFVLEGVIPSLLREPELARYLPIAALGSLAHAGSPTPIEGFGPATGALLLTGYVAVLALAAIATLRRRDVH